MSKANKHSEVKGFSQGHTTVEWLDLDLSLVIYLLLYQTASFLLFHSEKTTFFFSLVEVWLHYWLHSLPGAATIFKLSLKAVRKERHPSRLTVLYLHSDFP